MFDRIRKKVVLEEDLPKIRETYKDKKIAFCSGCFDILQPGHAVFFSQCKEQGEIVIVGIGRDETIQALKGAGRPVNPENNRVYLAAALEEVDFAVLNDENPPEAKIDFYKKLDLLRPDYFVINDDDSAIEKKRELCEKFGIEIRLVKREVPEELVPTSTSNIIDKINFSLKAPLRIDFAGGWTDVPYIMDGKKGYVSNVAIRPLIEYIGGKFNFSGYPRGSGLSTSTAAKLLEMLNSKNYNADPKNLVGIGEDLFNLENMELQWFIGRQDQYSIVFGGFNCFEFGTDYARPIDINISKNTLQELRSHLILIHTGESRNAQVAVEEVYRNYKTKTGQEALDQLGKCGLDFAKALENKDFELCAQIIERNWEAQKILAPSTSNETLDAMYDHAKSQGALGGKLCGAGGGGAFLFYTNEPEVLKKAMKSAFVNCFEIDFDFEYQTIKELNHI